MTRVLLVGDWRFPIYEEAFARGLEECGAQVARFSVMPYFAGRLGHVQRAFPVIGPAALACGRAIVAAADAHRPDIVLFWRPVHILRRTLAALRQRGIATASYNNDDPFSPLLAAAKAWRNRNLWRLYRQALPDFDYNFFFREVNRAEALAAGARHAAIMLPYFRPWQDRPVTLSEEDRARFGADVVFAGHFDDDGRDHDVMALARAGLRVRVWGDDTWNASAIAECPDIPQPIERAGGEDYTKALSGADICLCYMSKLNRDAYTRRCFEIPATGRLMLAERTEALTQMFRPDVEACFFSDRAELLAEATRLMGDPELRNRIAAAGLARVWADGHDVAHRAGAFLDAVRRAGATAPTAPVAPDRPC